MPVKTTERLRLNRSSKRPERRDQSLKTTMHPEQLKNKSSNQLSGQDKTWLRRGIMKPPNCQISRAHLLEVMTTNLDLWNKLDWVCLLWQALMQTKQCLKTMSWLLRTKTVLLKWKIPWLRLTLSKVIWTQSKGPYCPSWASRNLKFIALLTTNNHLTPPLRTHPWFKETEVKACQA